MAEEAGTILCEFLEAIVHEVLCLRGLYSKELFTRHRLYDISVRKSRHPLLNEYISTAVQGIKDPLSKGRLEKVAVLILDSSGFTVERYVVQLSMRPEIFPSLDFEDVESALRSVLLKLQYADANMKPLPKGCTFEFVAYTYSLRDLDVEKWVERFPDDSPEGSRQGFRHPPGPQQDPEGPKILPIKSASVGSGALKLQLFAEVQ